MTGIFITFEGIDGVGKTTQVSLLKAFLEEKGLKVLTTREPGGTALGEQIRSFMSSNLNFLDHFQEKSLAELFLFITARFDHLENRICPALKRGEVVICDRYIDSTRVYQSDAGEATKEFIDILEKLFLIPDITFILDAPVELAQKNISGRVADMVCFDNATKDVLEKRRQGFLNIARQNPTRCFCINAARSMEEVFFDIRDKILKKFPQVLHVT